MNNLGIIAGGGMLPIMVAKNAKMQVYVVALEHFANPQDFVGINCHKFNIGHVGKILEYFESNKVKEVVIAGNVTRPNLKDINVDMKGAILMAKIMGAKFLGDDKLLRIVADYIESHNLIIKSPMDFLDNNDIKTVNKPTAQQLQDIEYGKMIVSKLGELDVGQAAVVEQGLILGVEAAEGTDALIARCANYSKEEAAILVKMAKPNQDIRLDTPVIGIDTIINISNAKMAGIAIEKDKVIILDHENVLEAADRLGIFIHLF
ncbi:MAG UNVERIFIED_CONTAM: UDP-2,3-diacylglucosamine diphosphatase LpxI [Rickettsiaceae bacterium]|jgi:DUF1009 family protein